MIRKPGNDHTVGERWATERTDGGRTIPTDAPDRASRLAAEPTEPAGAVVDAVDADMITVGSGAGSATTGLDELPAPMRAWPPNTLRYAPERVALAALRELSAVSSYFAISTGPTDQESWRPVAVLYADQARLADAVDQVAQRICTTELRVAASTFFLGFAARLWSVGLGGLAEHRLLFDLDPDQLQYRSSGGTVELHLKTPAAWEGDNLAPRLADLILDAHLRPLCAAVRRLCPVSEKLLWGNAASAVLGAARALNRHHGVAVAAAPRWRLARTLCGDERLVGTVRFTEGGRNYRRTTCCLFYRSSGAGLCTDCVLHRKPHSTRWGNVIG